MTAMVLHQTYVALVDNVQLFCHCVFICCNVHWKWASFWHDGSALILLMSWVMWNKKSIRSYSNPWGIRVLLWLLSPVPPAKKGRYCN